MKPLLIPILLLAACHGAIAQQVRDHPCFTSRIGDWSGRTVMRIPSQGRVIHGTDRMQCRFLLNGAFFEMTGSTDAGGAFKQYKWIFRQGPGDGDYLFTYMDSNGGFDDGAARLDPQTKALVIEKDDDKTGNHISSESTVPGPDEIQVRHVLKGADGQVLFEGDAAYSRETVGQGETGSSRVDPFADAGSSGKGTGVGPMDMADPGKRDICISLWYLNMAGLVDDLERQTGHRFEKRVGKLDASPVEILEEQAAFMKRFLETTKRLESQ